MWGRRFAMVMAAVACASSLSVPGVAASDDPAGSAIVGGDVVDAATVPWTVALFYGLEPDPFAAQFCGGVLIHTSWVLTARHCTEGLPFSASQIQVGFGKSKLSDYAATDRRSVDAIFRHTYRDVALLRLAKPATGARTIGLWRDAPGPQIGQPYRTYGWGTRSTPEPDYPDQLHGVQLVDLAGEAPASPCGAWGGVFVSGIHVCAGVDGGGGSPCFGDSGGPLVSDAPKPELVGLTSFGPELCGDAAMPAVFARVSEVAAWIDEVVAQRTTWGMERVSGTPAPAASPVAWAEVDTGGGRACGVGVDGSMWCWTDGSSTYSFTRPAPDNDWLHVETGEAHTCAIKIDRSAWCWGANSFGQSGILVASQSPPRRVIGDARWSEVSAGGTSSCGIRVDGTLWCWGDNAFGQLGTGDGPRLPDPMRVGTASDWTSISVGEHVCGTRADGSLWCWGRNDDGRLGDGTTERRSVPTRIAAATTWDDVVVEGAETCARTVAGALACWTGPDGPTPVVGLADVRVFDHNGGQRCAITGDGALWCWGRTPWGASIPSPTRVDPRNDWQEIDVAGTRVGIARRGHVDALRVQVTYSSAQFARMQALGAWVGYPDVGELQKLATFVDAFIIAISPPEDPSPILLPPPGSAYSVTSFWMPSEQFVLAAVERQRVLDAVGAHRWGVQVLDFIATLNGV